MTGASRHYHKHCGPGLHNLFARVQTELVKCSAEYSVRFQQLRHFYSLSQDMRSYNCRRAQHDSFDPGNNQQFFACQHNLFESNCYHHYASTRMFEGVSVFVWLWRQHGQLWISAGMHSSVSELFCNEFVLYKHYIRELLCDYGFQFVDLSRWQYFD